MIGLSTRLGRAVAFILDNPGSVFAALLPLAIFSLRPEILNNRIGDVDTWSYFGHFTSFPDYRSVEIA